MRFQLRRCDICNTYSLKSQCGICKNDTVSAHPAKFSPDDKYMKLRIMEKFS